MATIGMILLIISAASSGALMAYAYEPALYGNYAEKWRKSQVLIFLAVFTYSVEIFLALKTMKGEILPFLVIFLSALVGYGIVKIDMGVNSKKVLVTVLLLLLSSTAFLKAGLS